MEIAGLVLMSVALILIIHNTVLCTQLGEDHSFILRKLNNSDPKVGSEGHYDGEVRDLIWIDNSLRKVRWNQSHGSWELVKK